MNKHTFLKIAYRVTSKYLSKKAVMFNLPIGTPVLYGKYKNKKGIIKDFGVDAKGNPTVIITPLPKGRKKDKEIGLFRIWEQKGEPHE